MMPRVEGRFERIEVTEVFATVPPWQIEGAMRARNGVPDKLRMDFEEFRKGVPRGRPSRVEERRAAVDVIAKIESKLAKASYGNCWRSTDTERWWWECRSGSPSLPTSLSGQRMQSTIS